MLEDIRQAATAVEQAAEMLRSIAALPMTIGDRVRWAHNGVVWRRVGGNHWINDEDENFVPSVGLTWPSSHVAVYAWEQVR